MTIPTSRPVMTGFVLSRDPDTVHAPGAAPVVLGEGDTLGGGDVVPGFDRSVRELTV